MIRRTLLLTGAALALSVAQALAGEPVRLGVALSQSGNLADSAVHYQHGLELCARPAARCCASGTGPRRVQSTRRDLASDIVLKAVSVT